ncbi:tocopherol cyclase family protein [Bacteroidota bacterium]|nr:tocopherol cyclase family protein [Bacteroidota bacterium]
MNIFVLSDKHKKMIAQKIRGIWNPELYHGWEKKKRFFEGWYYKIVSKDEKNAFAFIPGIAIDENGNKQAFIQILDGKKSTSEYIKFPFDSFKANPKKHIVEIDKNRFTTNSIDLNLKNIRGSLNFQNITPWSSSFFSPGIMGPFSFVPFMECYHGILSMDHTITGELSIKKKKVDFTSGRGYTEKDWGHSFPIGYVWMQSNHFRESEISFKCSVAKIPFKIFSFNGFIAGLWLKNKLIEFTTYNFSKVKKCKINEKQVEIEIENPKHTLKALVSRSKTATLAAPIQGFMDAKIDESMTSKIEVKLIERKTNTIIFDDVGRNAGCEVAGNYSILLKN